MECSNHLYFWIYSLAERYCQLVIQICLLNTDSIAYKYIFSYVGVVLSFSNLSCQVNSMISAWQWTAKDTILHTLPLHHIHGVVNGLMTPLHCGAR